MSDQIRDAENAEARAVRLPDQVTRRGFGAIGAAGAFAACAGAAKAKPATLVESRETVATPHGAAQAWFIRPDTGRHPGVVMWPDAAGLRNSTLAVARGLAAQGLSVLVVDRTYREAKLAELNSGQGDTHHAVQLANRDARAFVAWLNAQNSVQTASAKSGGMSGIGHGYSLRSVSAAHPQLSLATKSERMAAAQSAFLFAVPDATVASMPEQMAKLSEAARLTYRAAVAA
jgi:carboxymethylenebutenolidase